MAGLWFIYVSRPLFQFLIFRWFWRVLIWDLFLWRVSRMPLELIPTHPDRCAGLSFLGSAQYVFAPLMFGLAAIFSGDMGERILYEGAPLQSLGVGIGLFIGLVAMTFLIPLVFFAPQLLQARRMGLLRYGVLASHYVRRFQEKWIPGKGSPKEELLGTGDIQSLADLSNSFSVIQTMRFIPMDMGTLVPMVASLAIPFIPLLLSIFTPREIFQMIKQIIF
jgi:hypothetical protein